MKIKIGIFILLFISLCSSYTVWDGITLYSNTDTVVYELNFFIAQNNPPLNENPPSSNTSSFYWISLVPTQENLLSTEEKMKSFGLGSYMVIAFGITGLGIGTVINVIKRAQYF